MRKIIQIQVLLTTMGTRVVALCNDGTVWTCDVIDNKWVQLPEIPK